MSKREELAQHRRNLETLQFRAASFGAEPPVDLQLQIQAEKAVIEQLETWLAINDEPAEMGSDDDMAEQMLMAQVNRLGEKLDKLTEQVSELKQAQFQQSVLIGQVQRDVQDLRGEVEKLRRLPITAEPEIPRWVLIGGSIAIVVVLTLLIFISVSLA